LSYTYVLEEKELSNCRKEMGRKGFEEQQRVKNCGETEWVKIMGESLNETG
jgi:hypothetical protein